MKKVVLVVDDSITNLKFIEKTICAYYDVVLAQSGMQALKYLKNHVPDLILLDIHMPYMDGYETIVEIKKIPSAEQIPVIFLTASEHSNDEIKGLELGAVDFIIKPFVAQSMLQRIRNQMELAEYRKNLEQMVREKTRQIEKIQDAIVITLIDLMKCRDGLTGGHLIRVASYTEILLQALYQRKKYLDIIDEQYISEIRRGAYLHDIGKIGIADKTLLKDSRLTEQEREYMKQHTILGGEVLDKVLKEIGEESFLTHSRDLAYYHHEKWNGTGYPFGISGTDIPLSARILSIADVYDALTSKRSYKEPFSHEKSVEIVVQDSGVAFDPEIIEVFQEIEGEFHKAKEKFEEDLIQN